MKDMMLSSNYTKCIHTNRPTLLDPPEIEGSPWYRNHRLVAYSSSVTRVLWNCTVHSYSSDQSPGL